MVPHWLPAATIITAIAGVFILISARAADDSKK
jgi:hypothetical protein